MNALVVYESMFGNTRQVAEAVAEGLGEHLQVTLVDVAEARVPTPGQVDLLVVGGPTHVRGLSRPSTRKDAMSKGAAAVDVGLREWLERLEKGRPAEPVAAFDTRLAKGGWLAGSAARRAEKVARRHGYRSLGHASFLVGGTTGPLVDGELARARAWGASLGTRVAGQQPLGTAAD